MLLNAGDPVRVAHGADADNKNIVRKLKPCAIRSAFADDLLSLRINARADCLVIPHVRAGFSDWLNDTAELDCPNRGAGQQGSEQKIVARAYSRHLEQPRVNLLEQTERCKSGPKNDEFWFFNGGHGV